MISHGGGLEFEKGERETTVYRGAGLRVTFNDSPSGGKGSAPPIDARFSLRRSRRYLGARLARLRKTNRSTPLSLLP